MSDELDLNQGKKKRKLAAKKPASNSAMPRAVARRIMARASRGEKAVVVVMRQGKPTKVYAIEKYLRMQSLPKEVEPWTHRHIKATPNPLNAMEGQVVMPITRANIYDD